MTDKTGPYPTQDEINAAAFDADEIGNHDFHGGVRFGVDWERKRAAAYSRGGTLTAEECEDVAFAVLQTFRGQDARKLAAKIRDAAQPTVGLTAETLPDDIINAGTVAAERAFPGDPRNGPYDRLAFRQGWDEACKYLAGSQPPMGLTREDVERIADLLERGGTALWQAGEDADVMRECDALSARLRSISTSDRVLATYYGVEVVGPEEARPCIDVSFLCSLGTFADDTDWGHTLRVTSIHVTATTEGDDQ